MVAVPQASLSIGVPYKTDQVIVTFTKPQDATSYYILCMWTFYNTSW